MSIDPRMLSAPNSPCSPSSSPDDDFWADSEPYENYITSKDDIAADLVDPEQLQAGSDRLDELMQEAVVPFQSLANDTWSQQQMRADQERLDQLMQNITEPTQKQARLNATQPGLETWHHDQIFTASTALDFDPTRRRSQSQPPSAHRPQPLLSPISNMPTPIHPPRPAIVRAATAVPRRFHPYTGRPGFHQRSYTSHPGPETQPARGRPRFPPQPAEPTQHPQARCQSLEVQRSAPAQPPYNFHLHHDQTSLALGLQTQLAALAAQCAAMQQHLAAVFAPGGECGEGHVRRADVESKRLCARRVNREVRELHEPLQQLPIHDPECREVSAPLTGSQVQALGHEAMDGLLKAFEVYHSSDMFLWEKKAVWLRFIGASRELMHKVLD